MTAQSENKELHRVDEVMITQSGNSFIEDQALMEEMLQQLADQRKEIDRLNEQALKSSVEFQKIKSQLQTSNAHLFKMLDEKEAEFERAQEFESVEICIDYIDAALYCQNYFSRKSNWIEEAIGWRDKQPVRRRSILENFKGLHFGG